MRLIIDADSIIFSSAITCDTLDEAKVKFQSHLDYLLRDLSDICEFDDIWICNGSTNNFRVRAKQGIQG